MRILSFLLTSLFAPLIAQDAHTPVDPIVSAMTEGAPRLNIGNGVNPITGDFYFARSDLVIDGAEPLSIDSIYVSGKGVTGWRNKLGWEIVPHHKLIVSTCKYCEINRVIVADKNGSRFTFDHALGNEYHIDLIKRGKGITNDWKGQLSARTNPRNFYVLKNDDNHMTLHCADGTVRRYKFRHKKEEEPDHFYSTYLLKEEKLPNGNRIEYDYDSKERLSRIKTTNPDGNKTYAWAKFSYSKEHDFRIETSDGRWLAYEFEKQSYEHEHDTNEVYVLKKIRRSFGPTEAFTYVEIKEGILVSSVHYPKDLFLSPSYYSSKENGSRKNRVKTLSAPVGAGKAGVITHQFVYNDNKRHGIKYENRCETQIFDAEGYVTKITASTACRPQEIEWHQNHQLVCFEKNLWGKHFTESGNLKAKLFCDSSKQIVFAKVYDYDIYGNVVAEKWCGNLSGQSLLPVKLENPKPPPPRFWNFGAKQGTGRIYLSEDHVLQKVGIGLYVLNDEKPVHQNIYKVNSIKKGEVTLQRPDTAEREIKIRSPSEIATTTYGYTDTHLMAWKKDQSGRLTRFTYFKETDLLASRFTYDDDKIVLREEFEYDIDHLLIQKKISDGIEEKTETITYLNGKPHTIIGDLKKIITYTPQGKVAAEEIYDSVGQFQYKLSYEYDEKGRLISRSNPLGQIAKTAYDELGNKILETDFSGRVTRHHTYDAAGRLIQTTEEGDDGNRRSLYTRYNHKSQKIHTLDSDGRETHFSYDMFGNVTATEDLFLTYDTFGRPLTTTDKNGHTTTKTYNSYGKITLILHADGTEEKFIYNLDGTLKTSIDALGTAIEHQYDTFGHLISKGDEKWHYSALHLLAKTDAAGNVTTYTYDKAGKKTSETVVDRKMFYTYDAMGRLSATQSENRITKIEYDLLDRVVQERIEDENGTLLTQVFYSYDTAGNKTEVAHGNSTEITLFDSFKRPIKHADALGHITTTVYEPLKKITTDPNGCRLIEIYDTHGRILSLEVKNPFNEQIQKELYTYDPVGNKIKQETYVSPTKIITTLWEYGPLKRLLSLTEAAGTPEQRTTRYTYCLNGLLSQLHKPSGIVLTYTYDAKKRLSELFSSDGTVHYQFTYNAHHQPILIEDLILNTTTHRYYNEYSELIYELLGNDLALHSLYDNLGRKTTLILPDNSGVSYTYDAAFLRTVSRNNYQHHYTKFDLSGHLLEQQLIFNLGTEKFQVDPLGRTTATTSPFFQSHNTYDARGNLLTSDQNHYTYDDLSQLTSEKNHTYTYDALHNRLSKDGRPSSVNSLNQYTHLTYDPDGNLLFDGANTYTYDALDRITSITNATHHAKFTYDAFHRRLTKNNLRFIYDADNEIGAVNSNDTLLEHRILGIGKGAEIGAAIAIELQNNVFAPIHDFRGNVVHLVQNNQIVESYTYTAFGEETCTSTQNPWRFSSKRTETEFNLVFFGRRFYSPTLGRWLNPDPQGFTDGMNLYAFVHNNPLLKLDLYGLAAYNIQFSVDLQTIFQLAGSLIQYTGEILSVVGTHFIPSFLGGTFLSALGHTLAGKEYEHHKSEVATVGSRTTDPSVRITQVNGINTTTHDSYAAARQTSNLHGGAPVRMIYNATHGILSDILEVLLDVFGIGSHPSRLLARNGDQ